MNPVEKQLIEHEGLEKRVYRCPAGRLTVDVGRNLEDKGITEEEAQVLWRLQNSSWVAQTREEKARK